MSLSAFQRVSALGISMEHLHVRQRQQQVVHAGLSSMFCMQCFQVGQVEEKVTLPTTRE